MNIKEMLIKVSYLLELAICHKKTIVYRSGNYKEFNFTGQLIIFPIIHFFFSTSESNKLLAKPLWHNHQTLKNIIIQTMTQIDAFLSIPTLFYALWRFQSVKLDRRWKPGTYYSFAA